VTRSFGDTSRANGISVAPGAELVAGGGYAPSGALWDRLVGDLRPCARPPHPDYVVGSAGGCEARYAPSQRRARIVSITCIGATSRR